VRGVFAGRISAASSAVFIVGAIRFAITCYFISPNSSLAPILPVQSSGKIPARTSRCNDECGHPKQGRDVAYQDLVQKAKEMQQSDGTTEKVRQAIAYMHAGGKMGERGDDALMSGVALVTQSIDLDHRRLGMTTWCESRQTNLAGFVHDRM
jgi:hypothetical protein